MITKIHNSPRGVHGPFSQYSHSVTVEGAQKLIFCAGQVAGEEQGNILGPDDFEAQGELVIENLTRALAEAGATLTDIVKLTCYVCSPHDVKRVRIGQATFSEQPAGQHDLRAAWACPSRLFAGN